MNGRKRKVQIKFYVTEEERALIEQKMKLVPTRYNGPIISDRSSKNYREHGKIQQESEKETTP